MGDTWYSDPEIIQKEKERAGGAIIRWWARDIESSDFISLNLPAFFATLLDKLSSIVPTKQWLSMFYSVHQQEGDIWVYEMALKIAKSINCQFVYIIYIYIVHFHQLLCYTTLPLSLQADT